MKIRELDELITTSALLVWITVAIVRLKTTFCSRILNKFVNLFSMVIPFYEDFASVTVYNRNNAIRPNQWEFGYSFTSRM